MLHFIKEAKKSTAKIYVAVDGSFFEKETTSANQLMSQMKGKQFKQRVLFENELINKRL